METSLHQQLKALYAGDHGQTEVKLGKYRIDAVVAGELVEVQHGGLGAIRDKIRRTPCRPLGPCCQANRGEQTACEAQEAGWAHRLAPAKP